MRAVFSWLNRSFSSNPTPPAQTAANHAQPAPLSTDTPPPLPTDTPLPMPTATPLPAPTDTPIPPPTEPPAQPANMQITYIYYYGQVPRVETDEYAQITNQGGSVVNLFGWHLNAGDPGLDFWFPAFDLQPGQSCRVYTNEYHPESCRFNFGNSQALWNNSDHDCGHLYNGADVEVSVNCY